MVELFLHLNIRWVLSCSSHRVLQLLCKINVFYISEHFFVNCSGWQQFTGEHWSAAEKRGGQKEGTRQGVDSSEEMKILLWWWWIWSWWRMLSIKIELVNSAYEDYNGKNNLIHNYDHTHSPHHLGLNHHDCHYHISSYIRNLHCKVWSRYGSSQTGQTLPKQTKLLEQKLYQESDYLSNRWGSQLIWWHCNPAMRLI